MYSALVTRILTKVFGGGPVITEDCDDPGPEHLQGGHVGREDTKCTSECGHIYLFDTGLLVVDLREWRGSKPET